MVMPPQPIADLVIAQARFALAAVEAFFDAVFGLGNASELLERGVGGGVREVVVVLESSIRLAFTRDEQHFLRTCAARRCAGLDAAHRGVDHEWSLLAITHVERRPGCAAHQRSTRCHGTLGWRPRPEYFGGATSRSRINMFEGTASRYRSLRVRKASRNGPQRPISSSPAIQPCGN